MVNNANGSDCQIFLSHSGHQKLVAEGLFKHLTEILRNRSSSAIFFDRSVTSIPMGARIFKNIETAIMSCKVGVLIISPNFFESYWPMRELELLVKRTRDKEDPISLYPIFYNTRDINKALKSETASLGKWEKTWEAFEEVDDIVDVKIWAQYVVQVKQMRGKILQPNETVELQLYNMAMEIAEMLPSSLCAPRPLPPPPSQANYNEILDLEIRKEPAQYKYITTQGSLLTRKHVSFYFQPNEFNASQYNHRPTPCLLGQRPELGLPNKLAKVETLLFTDFKQAQSNTCPIGGGNEWWECIWTDRGQVIYRDDLSCWRVKADQIPRGFVCLSPYFFKIDTLEKRINHSLANFMVLKEDYMPPSSEDVQGMVAIKEGLATYVTGEQLIKVWEDRGSRATQDLAVYTGPDFSGCFAFDTYDPPTGGEYPILNRTRLR